MHYEEDDHRNHQERWQHGSRNRRPRPESQEHFNDFASRWNEPVPPLHSFRTEEDDERARFRNYDRNSNMQGQHPHHRDQYEQWYQSKYRNQQDSGRDREHWQQQEEYNRHNQYANDRWHHQDDYLMHEEELRRRYNRQFRDWEEDRRNRRRQ
ncbi:hypothetical protein ACMA1I_00645 [Pontibacter sp. 13R65]|uniref:hypothetical protein n=1 Tax=Pontibacter sp. 13R65 TaxID=3127458 RepID=UPI00301C4056